MVCYGIFWSGQFKYARAVKQKVSNKAENRGYELHTPKSVGREGSKGVYLFVEGRGSREDGLGQKLGLCL